MLFRSCDNEDQTSQYQYAHEVRYRLPSNKTQLTLEGLQYQLVELYDENVPQGTVISLDPEPLTQVIRDTVVELRVSLGPPPEE